MVLRSHHHHKPAEWKQLRQLVLERAWLNRCAVNNFHIILLNHGRDVRYPHLSIANGVVTVVSVSTDIGFLEGWGLPVKLLVAAELSWPTGCAAGSRLMYGMHPRRGRSESSTGAHMSPLGR